MRYKVTTAATFDAITLANARLQVKEPSNITAEDDLLRDYIKFAGKQVEHYTNRVIGTSTLTGYLDDWPTDRNGDTVITINRNPVTSISSVKYYDSSNVLQTLVVNTDYIVDTVAAPARIYMINTPDLYTRPNAIEIEFVAGYASISAVDPRIKQAVRLLVSEAKMYRTDFAVGNIISQLPRGVKDLMNTLRIDEL